MSVTQGKRNHTQCVLDGVTGPTTSTCTYVQQQEKSNQNFRVFLPAVNSLHTDVCPKH